MASRLQQLASRVWKTTEPMYNMARSQTIKQYETLMANNQQYVVKDEEAAKKLFRQWFFTRMSSIPGGIAHAEQEWAILKGRLRHFTDLPVPEMGTYLLFAGELYAWFVVGEVIGRGGSLTGYNL